MTEREKIIVSAYTGYLMCDFEKIHSYIEEKLGRPIFTHEMIDDSVWKEIKESIKKDFIELCRDENND